MIRVRRKHYRAMCTRPPVLSRRPYTHLVSVAEGLKMFDIGIDIGEHRGEQASEFDKGWNQGFRAGFDAALEDLRDTGGES